MIPSGDTTSIAVRTWAFNQAEHIGGNHLLMLLVLTHFAFVRENNPEHAPVGQVMKTYASVSALSAWTGGMVPTTVRRTLAALQTEHGYITRQKRPPDGNPGSPPNIIRVHWTGKDDLMRESFRAGRSALPEEFDPVSPALNVVRFDDRRRGHK